VRAGRAVQCCPTGLPSRSYQARRVDSDTRKNLAILNTLLALRQTQLY